MEDKLLAEVADNLEIKHMVLIMRAVNAIDASALEALENLIIRLRDSGVLVHFAEVKGPVMDRLNKVNFEETLGDDNIYLSTHKAMLRLQVLTKP